ncbi:putative PEP-binding protein [Petroclostridium sp. X23]|uniref:putative PEP-binding protein n=1 Tax=Petroclostridium sp. X23 TaxID=3045146 RepID=UPI0024AD4E71|nr:putative PEP-binding protein [Petroclostridium sp. X23]WHH61565.1 hypothetical protein QKW49_13055 [Petroclostridium sp. X23]
MIVTVEELKQAKKMLYERNIKYDKDIEVGIMVETPAAAVMTKDLAKEVDFFSIGTNDLIQYMTASDRLNVKVQNLYDTCNIAVLRMVQQIIEAGHSENIRVGICSEMASDYKMVPILVGMELKN